MTQDEAAARLGMKRSTLSGYENQVALPGIDALLQFAAFYHVAVDTLLKIDLASLRESQVEQLERGEDVFLKGGNLRILASTVGADNQENIELVPVQTRPGTTAASPIRNTSGSFLFRRFLFIEREKIQNLPAQGDSMCHSGEKAWVTGEYVANWKSLNQREACIVLTLDEGIVFKIIENRIEGEGSWGCSLVQYEPSKDSCVRPEGNLEVRPLHQP
ncbi:MAG: helix-turn-helix transcriptional regulator [Bacteroidales bacterium]